MATTPKTAGKFHAYATEYPEYGNSEVLSTLPVAKHKNRFVPSDTGTESKAGAGRGFVNPPRPDDSSSERSPAVQEAIQEMQDAKSRKKISDMGFKKGGKVSSASSRADGCAVKGKTKGRIV